MPNRVEGIGPLEPNLMAIGEAPGREENLSGKPFIGPPGQLLDTFFFNAGINRSEIYITNVVKYQPPFNDFDKLHLIGVDLDKSIEELWQNEIRLLRPKCILAIGDRALQAVCGLSGILNYRGSILLAKDGKTKVVPMIHPAALFSKGHDDQSDRSKGGISWTYTQLMEHDVKRAYEESKTRELNLPDRSLMIAHNSVDVMRFFQEYKNLDKACMDIESINCVPVCIGFAFNKHHALSIPLLRQIKNVKLTDMGNNEMNEVWREVDRQLRRLKLIGHNIKYDDYKLSLIGFQCSNIYSDTLIKCRIIFPELPRKQLHVLASLFTREPFYKEEGKEFQLGKHKIDRLLLYNGKDCAVDFEVDEMMEVKLIELAEKYKVPLLDYYYKYQMKKHKFYLNMENTGFNVDRERQKELFKRYTLMEQVVHNRITSALGEEVNVKSSPQKYTLLYKVMKFKPLRKAPTSEDAIIRLLGNHCKGMRAQYKPILEDILEESRIRDQKSKAIGFTPDFDGRCKSTFNIISTETTRSSTGILKAPLRPKGNRIGLGFHTIPKHGRLAKDIRSMFICDPGYVMIQIDASQAEPRVVAVLSKDWKLLEAFDNKVDIHRRTAGMLFGYIENLNLDKEFKHEIVDNLEKDGPERFTGKTVRNAGNYDVQKGTLMETFNTNAQKFEIQMTISEWKAGQMLEMFHNSSPNLKQVFHADIKECIDSSRMLIDPFGGVREFTGKFDEKIYKEAYANIPQRTVAHVVQGAALKIEEELNDKKMKRLWYSENHDALVLGAPENDWEIYARLMKKHMEVPVDFNIYCSLKRDYKLTIPAEVEVSNTNYANFEKVKL